MVQETQQIVMLVLGGLSGPKFLGIVDKSPPSRQMAFHKWLLNGRVLPRKTQGCGPVQLGNFSVVCPSSLETTLNKWRNPSPTKLATWKMFRADFLM